MPWADKTRLAPIHLMAYLKPFFDVSVINIFFLGALFYCVAALSRRIVVVYLQGVSILALYLILAISVIATNKLDRLWASVVDPLGMVYMSSIMRYWTVVERNTRFLEWTGPFLYNRLMWTGVGVVALALTYVLFPMSAEQLTSRRVSKKAKEAAEAEELEKKAKPRTSRLPLAHQIFSFGTSWQQFAVTDLGAHAKYRPLDSFLGDRFPDGDLLRDRRILRRPNQRRQSVACHLPDAGRATRWRLALFLYIVAAMYAGELIWDERDVRFDQIHDALPQKDWVDWLSKFFALSAGRSFTAHGGHRRWRHHADRQWLLPL